MWLAVLFAWGNLITFTASQSCGEASKDAASWVKLKPLGHCRDGENMCPYAITFPPLTIQLPRHFRELEKMARELQSLTMMVNQLREECQECRGRQTPEWSVRTDNGEESGERVQASRGIVNTRERQQHLNKRGRIVQSTTPNSAEEDTMLISSGTREVNRVIGIPGWNMSHERNTPSSSGQGAESSGGPKGSHPLHMETAADSSGEVRELHSLTGEERAKELDSPKAKKTESPLPESLDDKQPTHHGKASPVKVWHEQDTNGTLAMPGNIEDIPKISLVAMVSEDVDAKTKQVQVNPHKDKELKRLPGLPQPMDNKKEGKLNPNIENRLKNPGGARRVYSPVRDRPLQSTARVPARTGNARLKMPQMADRKRGTGDTNITGVIIKTPHRMVNKDFSGERNPSVKGKNNREMEVNMTEIITNINQKDDNKQKVSDTGAKQLNYFSLDETGNVTVSMGGHATVAQYPMTENKDSKKKNNTASSIEQKPFNRNTDVERATRTDLNPITTVKTISELEKSHLFVPDKADAINASHTNPDVLDSKSESQFSFSIDTESDTRIDSNRFNSTKADNALDMSVVPISDNSDPIANISKAKPQTKHSNSGSTFNPSIDAKSNTDVLSSPVSGVQMDGGLTKTKILISDLSDATVYASHTNAQNLSNDDDLSNGQSKTKPEIPITRPNSKLKISSSINSQTKRKDVLRINSTIPLNTDSVKQTIFSNRRDKNPLNGKHGPPVVSQVRTGRPWPSGLRPLKIPAAKIHSLNKTRNFGRVRQLDPPTLSMVKNITRVNPNHMEQPERTHPTKVILPKNPLIKPYVLQKRPGNENVETPLKVFPSKNTNGETENVMEIMNSRHRHPQIVPTTTNPKQELNSMKHELIQPVNPTVAMHSIVDQAHGEKAKTVPTVEAFNSLIYFKIENMSQNLETKLIHVAKPKNSSGKRELDPITHGVRDSNMQTVMNHHTVNNINRGRGSHQAVVDETEESDGRKRAKPFMDSSVDSSQENKEPFKIESQANSSGNILLTMKREGSKRKELTHPTTMDRPYTIKPLIKGRQGPVTQFTTTTASTSRFMDQDYVEKVETSSKMNASDKHVHYRLKDSHESKPLTEKTSDHDREDKQSDLNLQTAGKAGGSSDETLLRPNFVDSVQNRAIGSNPVVMGRTKNSTVSKESAPSSDSNPIIYLKHSKFSFTKSKSTENNNRYNNGNLDPAPVDSTERMRKTFPQKTTADSSSKENKKRPIAANNMEDRDNLKSQLFSTCQGQCDQRPTPQPAFDTWRSLETARDTPLHDCSDLKKNMRNGVYSVTPAGSKHASFHVFCDMEASGGGWTLIQHRLDGTISFNRSWDDYKKGFGNLTGEFWLGNDKIHWLTSATAMVLRVELKDLDGVKEYAQYDDFHVASESLNYQLTIGGYSGTAGNAMQYSKRFNHNQKYFSTPDRDNDGYPSGNCGAYYSSGWWFDACMAANLNGKYYQTKYKGVRNGIFWGTWHNISNEYYPTNSRQSFKTVRMMIRPRASSDF